VSEVLVDKDGNTSPRNAGRFLQMLVDREPVFEANLKKVKPAKGETRAEVEKYFRDKYERLKAFLRQTIDSREGIQCSL
jgi:DNA polymerase II small subunit/DNA polymerase delta subunit B